MSIARALAHRWRSLTGAHAASQRAAQAAFDAACAVLEPGDLAVDLGANAGIYTEKLAATGADVIAFEPDPTAFETLSGRVASRENVTLLQAAAAAQDGEMTLYRRTDFDRDPARHTTSSSLIADKRKLTDTGVIVVVKDVVAYLTTLDRDVALIKIDVEGAEVEIMEALLDAPLADRVAQVFVETHERSIPRLADRTDALRVATAGRVRPAVNWDWH